MATTRRAVLLIRGPLAGAFALSGLLLVGSSLASRPCFGQPAKPLLPEAAAADFSFQRLNRVYEAFLQELAPIELGPAQILLTSPSHSLTVLSHQASLQPSADGGHEAELELRFSGQGMIEADVNLGGVKSRLQDELLVPEQEISVRARVEVTRATDGFVIRTLELQDTVTVRIQSQLASRLFSICRPMSLVLVSLDCDLMERALTFLEVPLPAAGESYLLPDEELTELDRKRFLAYLEGA